MYNYIGLATRLACPRIICFRIFAESLLHIVTDKKILKNYFVLF